MIARANRLRDSTEFREIARFGKKYKSRNFSLAATVSAHPLGRYGFVVPKRVGNAAQRNLVKRRMRSACFGLMFSEPGLDVVIRAERSCSEIAYTAMVEEITDGVRFLRGKLS